MTQRFYITTPIYYVNGAPHIGHAYTSIAADVLARWARLQGREVFFLTGTDEHGQKVEKAAADAGIAPAGLRGRGLRAVPRRGGRARHLLRRLHPHHGAAPLPRLHRAVGEAGGRRATSTPATTRAGMRSRDETFYDEDELTRLADGTRLAPTGAPVEWVREPNYLFRLSAYQDRLLAYYEANPGFIEPLARRNEVVSFVRSGLRDLSVSRSSLRWGIPVPGDPQHVMYVWLDALTNYLSAVGYPDESAPRWPFWPADVHMVGKEIARFHAIYWPAFLMAAGLRLPRRVVLPRLVDRRGPEDEQVPRQRHRPAGARGDVRRGPAPLLPPARSPVRRRRRFQPRQARHPPQRGTRERPRQPSPAHALARSRATATASCPPRGALTEEDAALLAAADALPGNLGDLLARQALHEALEWCWRVIRAANAYIDRQAPWALRKTDPPRMAAVLRVLVDALRTIATVLQPFMPGSMSRMLDQLGVPPGARTLAALAEPLPAGIALPPPQGVFPRHVEVEA